MLRVETYLVILLDLAELQVLVSPVSASLLVFTIIEPRELSVRGLNNEIIYNERNYQSSLPYLHEVVQRVKIRDPLVAQDEEFVVSFLENCHPLAVDLEFLTMELDLGLATFLNISLELVDDFVFFLMFVIFNFDGLHVRAEFSLFQLFLKRKIIGEFYGKDFNDILTADTKNGDDIIRLSVGPAAVTKECTIKS